MLFLEQPKQRNEEHHDELKKIYKRVDGEIGVAVLLPQEVTEVVVQQFGGWTYSLCLFLKNREDAIHQSIQGWRWLVLLYVLVLFDSWVSLNLAIKNKQKNKTIVAVCCTLLDRSLQAMVLRFFEYPTYNFQQGFGTYRSRYLSFFHCIIQQRWCRMLDETCNAVYIRRSRWITSIYKMKNIKTRNF